MDAFIDRWAHGAGGAERANYQMFLTELCDALGVARPDPNIGGGQLENYVFEAPVRSRETEGKKSNKRIDLYKKGCFILEAKQTQFVESREAQPVFAGFEAPETRGRRHIGKSWDVIMMRARTQAEGYVFRLPAHHPAPPFLIVCDVGHCMEIYADFTGTGRNYSQFPDRKSYQIFLEDLKNDEVASRLRAIWQDPLSLDPTRERARVTRQIAVRLAAVSKALESRNHSAEEVAQFLMRCVFTMFAEDVDLLRENSFTDILTTCLDSPKAFVPMLESLWQSMDTGGFYPGIAAHVRHFNGGLFRNARAFPLQAEEIGELVAAARADWKQVEPAIFGTLLEQALDPKERARLGAHFTPRAYVDRLVNMVIMDPLRREWEAAKYSVYDFKDHGQPREALEVVRKFHHRLCELRVLDPACGTGNFLYASLELIKRLEAEVLDFYASLGGAEGLGFEAVDPHQFLGIELNPRAAAIAELVVWIGYLQWHYRTRTGHPAEPILREFRNIICKDAVLTWDGWPVPVAINGKEIYPNARLPDWPEADFIVGNPPFIGGKDLREKLGGGYAETLWKAHKAMNDSADFVMYWWDRAADILTRKRTRLVRFGFVTTNSITQVFQRRTIERYMTAKSPISLIYAINDHPWTKATKDAAAVRIAMTVAQAGKHEGLLEEVLIEHGLDSDSPHIAYAQSEGRINGDLTIGTDVSSAKPLLANEGIGYRGVQLMGSGFLLSMAEARHLGLGRREGLEKHIRPYCNGRDLMAHSRNLLAIDLLNLSRDQIRQDFPEIYQHLVLNVKENKDKDGKVIGRDANNRESYRKNWWIFGEPRKDLRPALENLTRYIATVETAKHRVFQFLDAEILPDNMLIAITSDDAGTLGLLSSRTHKIWVQANAASLGVYIGDVRYTKSRCFDPFPFPDALPVQKNEIGDIAEALDAHRKHVLAEHPHLTMTGLYNVLERLKAGIRPDNLTSAERIIFDDGLVLILKEYHDHLDAAVIAAYGWPADISDNNILANLVALNNQRAQEEAQGQVKWLRPDYQIPRFARTIDRKAELDLGVAETTVIRPIFPKDRTEQPLAVKRILERHGAMPENAVILAFDNGGRNKARILSVLQTLDRYGEIILENGQVVVNRAA
jgi:SAM-dependent methyltransferase